MSQWANYRLHSKQCHLNCSMSRPLTHRGKLAAP
uniref:Uncharacterized protein n=1 Tax=Anguilla anguilla TaxID=7936 RepID=A0A0E9UKY6_ANGAN